MTLKKTTFTVFSFQINSEGKETENEQNQGTVLANYEWL